MIQASTSPLYEPDVKPVKATFALSWFWFPEAQYGCASGVTHTKVGYTGGSTKNPTYYNLGDHTETVVIQYDPSQNNYKNLLDIFWKNHDSTSCKSRQYMSAIFYHDDEQKSLAEETKAEHQTKVRKQIQTKILPAERFYDAENYHQKYLLRNHPDLYESLNLTDEQLIKSHVAARINGYLGNYGRKADFEEESKKFGLNEDQIDYIMDNIRK